MANVRFKWDIEGFAELRNHPKLVRGMIAAAEQGSAGTPYEVDVVQFPHEGRRSGPRTTVQVWARGPEAAREVNDNPGSLTAVLNRAKV